MVKGIILALLMTIPVWSGDLTGYLKNYSFIADPAPGTLGVDQAASSTTRLRLQYQNSWGEGWWFEGAGETALTAQRSVLFQSGLFMVATEPFSYRLSDPDHHIFPTGTDSGTNFAGTFNLDRLLVRWSGDKTDVTIGRQAVAWGNAKMVNPTDILTPYAFTELDTEYRYGVDAVRIRHAFSAMSEVDVGYVFGPGGDMAKSALFVRGKTYIAETDATLTFMRFREHAMVGLDLARAFGGTGTWIETAIVETNRFNNDIEENTYLRLSIGADRQLTPTIYGFLEYHYNGAGADKRAGYISRSIQPAYTDGAVYLLGKHYLAMGLNVQLTPLTTLNGTLLSNIVDSSAFLTTRLEHSLSDNLDASIGIYLKTGKTPTVPPQSGILPGSFDEFGIYPGLLYVSLRWYF